MGGIKISLEGLNLRKLSNGISALLDDATMTEIHNLFAKTIEPWVPFREGVLAQSVEVTAEHVRYPGPYAHYVYTGEIYGPNIPIMQDGVVVGWFSPPGQKKEPTGRAMTYNTELHPLASKEWDKAAMEVKLDEFQRGVKEILERRARQIYG